MCHWNVLRKLRAVSYQHQMSVDITCFSVPVIREGVRQKFSLKFVEIIVFDTCPVELTVNRIVCRKSNRLDTYHVYSLAEQNFQVALLEHANSVPLSPWRYLKDLILSQGQAFSLIVNKMST